MGADAKAAPWRESIVVNKGPMRVVYCATVQDGAILIHQFRPSPTHKGRWSDGTRHALRLLRKDRFRPSPEEAVTALLDSERLRAEALEAKFAAEKGELERVIRIAAEWLGEARR